MKEIEVIISPDGKASIDLKGFKGKGCSEITEQISKVLGQKVSGSKKCEYWQATEEEKQHATQKRF